MWDKVHGEPLCTKSPPGQVTISLPKAREKKYVKEWMLKTRAKYTTGRHGYWKREVSRRKVRIVREVDMKHNTDQKLIQPVANALEESVKNVLLGDGHVEVALSEDCEVVVVVVTGTVGTEPPLIASWTRVSFTSIQSVVGNLLEK